LILYADEASVSPVPHLTHTYAPVGKTPSITISTEINLRLFLASAVSPSGDLVYTVNKSPFTGETIAAFLKMILDLFSQKIILIWDNALIHKCKAIKEFLANYPPAKRLLLVLQPTYSPELNADEQVWSYLKRVELKNTCNRNVKELKPKVIAGMEKLKDNPKLIQKFFRHPDLGFYN
jgi:transposase